MKCRCIDSTRIECTRHFFPLVHHTCPCCRGNTGYCKGLREPSSHLDDQTREKAMIITMHTLSCLQIAVRFAPNLPMSVTVPDAERQADLRIRNVRFPAVIFAERGAQRATYTFIIIALLWKDIETVVCLRGREGIALIFLMSTKYNQPGISKVTLYARIVYIPYAYSLSRM